MATKEEIRQQAEEDLFFFAQLVNPTRCFGNVHKKVLRWLMGSGDQILLLPRGHQKSWMMAVWCTWWITKHPDTTILYVSATEDLATQQLYVIKGMLESDVYSAFWPDMLEKNEGKRAEWSFKNIKVDHPIRKKNGGGDRTVAARSVGSNTTGLHADVIVFDDIVVPDNAYTMEGRNKVASSYSQFSSIANTGAITKVAGTRYHGKDIYGQMLDTKVETYAEDGTPLDSHPMYSSFVAEVEEDGLFLWPRAKDPKSDKWFGFDNRELAKIRAKYFAAGDRASFYGQYYNNPQADDEEGLKASNFQYYDRKHLKFDGDWKFKGEVLRVYCGIDLAYTTGRLSDYTACGVIGITQEGNIYILELLQFRTNKYNVMWDNIKRLYDKWMFKRIRIESNAGASLAIEFFKDQIREEGLALSIDAAHNTKEKAERCAAVLVPRYDNKTIWHAEGGFIDEYEEQITMPRPKHDDLRDAVAGAIEIAKPPRKQRQDDNVVVPINSRFGGRRA